MNSNVFLEAMLDRLNRFDLNKGDRCRNIKVLAKGSLVEGVFTFAEPFPSLSEPTGIVNFKYMEVERHIGSKVTVTNTLKYYSPGLDPIGDKDPELVRKIVQEIRRVLTMLGHL